MNGDRRALLRGLRRGAATLFGAAAAVGLTHSLQRPSSPEPAAYPVRRHARTGGLVSEETASAIRAAGAKQRWRPRWETRLIRPPGALPEEDFLAACIRCTRCQDACAPGAIRFFDETAGKHFHTPYIDPGIRACTPCLDCTQVCPTGALTPLVPADRQRVRMATVELREDLCLSYRARRLRDEQAMMLELGREPTESEAPVERRGPCGECFTACPARRSAITLEPGAFLAPVVHEQHCLGCGLCEEICREMVRGEPAIRIVPTRTFA